MEERINELCDGVKEILKILNGNGKIGMCAKVNILWACSVWIAIIVVGTAIKTFLF